MGVPQTERDKYFATITQLDVRIVYAMEMGRYPVTFAEWDSAREAGAPLHHPDDAGWGRGMRPVGNISWSDAKAYLEFLNERTGLTGEPDCYRLPSNAEWEYACRAGTSSRWYFGDDERLLPKFVWEKFSGEEWQRTMPVGGKPENPFGLYDMCGTIEQWCEDIYHDSYNWGGRHSKTNLVSPVDGSAWVEGIQSIPRYADGCTRVVRGSAWSSAHKHSGDRDRRFSDRGFRIARTLEPTAEERAVHFPSTKSVQKRPRFFEYDVFLSHNQRDGSSVLAKALEQRGLTVWHDGDADMSDKNVIAIIHRALADARFIGVCIGEDFRDSDWVRAEYSSGLAMEKRFGISSVLIVELSTDVIAPEALRSKQRLSARNVEYLAAYLRVANARGDVGALEPHVGVQAAFALREDAKRLRNLGEVHIEVNVGTEEACKLALARYESLLAKNAPQHEIEEAWRELLKFRFYSPAIDRHRLERLRRGIGD